MEPRNGEERHSAQVADHRARSRGDCPPETVLHSGHRRDVHLPGDAHDDATPWEVEGVLNPDHRTTTPRR